MNIILNFLTQPWVLSLNSNLNLTLEVLTIRDKYLTYANIAIKNEIFIFFKEGYYLFEFDLINISKVNFAYKDAYLRVGTKRYNPLNLNLNEYFYDGSIYEILKRHKNFNHKNFKNFPSKFSLQYGDFQKVYLIFKINSSEPSIQQSKLILESGLLRKTINLSCHEIIKL